MTVPAAPKLTTRLDIDLVSVECRRWSIEDRFNLPERGCGRLCRSAIDHHPSVGADFEQLVATHNLLKGERND